MKYIIGRKNNFIIIASYKISLHYLINTPLASFFLFIPTIIENTIFSKSNALNPIIRGNKNCISNIKKKNKTKRPEKSKTLANILNKPSFLNPK